MIHEWISDEVMIRVAFGSTVRVEWMTTCPPLVPTVGPDSAD